MSNETDLDWLARNVHVWREGKREVLVRRPRNVDTLIWSSVSSDTGWITKDQWLARRAELQNKPSWGKAEEWAEWLAQDSYGCWGFFQKKPLMHALSWIARSGYYQIHSPGNLLLGDWRDTLEKRPVDLSGSAVTERLQEATDNVLAAVPELKSDKYKFDRIISIEDNQDQVLTQQQDNGWFERGELPPVGVECEIFGKDARPEKCKIIAYHKDQVAVQWESFGGGILDVLYLRGDYWKFRPIRTERDVLMDVIKQWDGLVQTDEVLADAILAAGFKRGVS